MIVTTTETVPGREIEQILGIARGNTIRAKHIGTDIVASLRNLVGGEIGEYTKMMGEAREGAMDRMIADGRAMGADAIIGMRLSTSMIVQGSAELLAFGTAVRLR